MVLIKVKCVQMYITGSLEQKVSETHLLVGVIRKTM